MIAGSSGYDELRFERQLRIFRDGRAPNLDVVLTAPGRVLAVESKLTEHLSRKPPASFSEAYERLRETAHPSWWAMYERLKYDPAAFTYLDAAQLVKHYFGLKKHCANESAREATLLYLYWEPEGAAGHPELALHRREVEEFAASVADPAVSFQALTYVALWRSWERRDSPPWLGKHLAELRRRYAVRLG